MTCIAGLVHKGHVWMGGDSAGVSSETYSLTVRADRKVFANGPFLIGFTSSFRMGQLLAHSFVPPKHHGEDDLMRFMVVDFVNALRDCLKHGGYAEKKDEVETCGTFLVGYSGRLFQIESDYQVGESIHGFDACGCGDSLALGSLFATQSLPDPKKRLHMALSAAETFSAGVRAPFHVIGLKA
jgi:ATP-dependent protease HslVU (ClpYQ) peptidase subunit